MKEFLKTINTTWWGIIIICVICAAILLLLSTLLYRQFFKRFYDLILSLIAIIVFLPLMLILTIVGAIAMKGNPFFVQKRPGKRRKLSKKECGKQGVPYGTYGKEKTINLLKFRTMTNEKDKDGNVKIGTTMTEGCKNSFFFSSNRLVTGVGLDDIILVETSDAILACKKDKTQDVKKVFDKLKEIKDETHLVHTTVYRPWGYYTVLNQGEGYLTKMICVSSHGQLSLQSHNFRSEHWVVLSGCARVTLDNKNYILKPGSSIDIPVKVKHSLGNPYKKELKIIEVQKGDKLVEEDIIRYKDIYGRVKA